MTALRFVATLAVATACASPVLAGTSLVVDASNGAVLAGENPTQAWHPASTTKMMTAYLALKAVREGRMGLETAIPVSKLAASQPRVKVYARAGSEITLDNALRIMMVKSANDIAYVIAEGVGGDVPNFVASMNAEAARLGMNDTNFVNPNGWHHPDQQTSARDLAVLAMAMMREFPDYADYWNTGAVQLGKQVLRNTNGLVGRYPGISGFKTGFVCASGFNVVATATRGGRTLIAVVMGSHSASERTVKAAQLLDQGFASWGGGWGGTSLASLPSGSGGRAQSVCDDVRRGGGSLADDAESAGPAAQAPIVGGNGDGTSDRFPIAAPQASVGGAMLTRSASGRPVLGPRAEAIPVPVAFGRTPGSDRAPLAANAVARPDTMIAGDKPVLDPVAPVAASAAGAAARRTASGNGSIPRSTSAFAPTNEPLASGAFQPLRLQGSAGAATAESLRPGAAAGIRPRTASRPDAKAEQAKAKPGAKAAAKPAAKPQPKPTARPAAKPAAKPTARAGAKPSSDS